MLKEFKQFIMRGNVIEVAVAFIMGAAFNSIVKSIVVNLISPIISIFTGSINLSNLNLKIGTAVLRYGSVLNEIINFIIIAFILFLIIKTFNKAFNKNKKKQKSYEEKIIKILSEIESKLKKTN